MADLENPFAALLTQDENNISMSIVESIFLFTVSDSSRNHSILNLSDIIVKNHSESISEDLLKHAVFERILLDDPEKYLISAAQNNSSNKNSAVETQCVPYLLRAFAECLCIQAKEDKDKAKWRQCDRILDIILTNCSTVMRQPELLQGQFLHLQWLSILTKYEDVDDVTQDFLARLIERMAVEYDAEELMGTLKSIFYPMLGELVKMISQTNLISMKRNLLAALLYLVQDKRCQQLGEVLIDFTTPNSDAKGSNYMDTLFGHLFRISIVPKGNSGPFEFFGEDVQLQERHSDPYLWQLMSAHQNSVNSVVKHLLKLNNKIKGKVLQWIGNCLKANFSRGQMWSNLRVSIDVNQSASDSFMLGLCSVLLRLCLPLCDPAFKVLLVDPTYCGSENSEVHMVDVKEETCLQSAGQDEERILAKEFNFITEIFYMTHKCFELSYRVCIEHLIRMSRELHNLQNTYRDIAENRESEFGKNLLRMLKLQMQQFLCLRNGLLEPENDMLVTKFLAASAIWLTEVSLVSAEEIQAGLEKRDFAPRTRRDRKIPISIDFAAPYLKSIPEYIFDNIITYLNFSRNFPWDRFLLLHPLSQDALFKMIILHMGSAELVKNPHLRAKLAEALLSFIPKDAPNNLQLVSSSQVFERHPDRCSVVRSLLNVFVSIEMTGQSVQFEQKFNYRRPMYAIIEYLWSKQEQVHCFRDLADEAERNMESIDPPIFLRFVNLLINDAIFLLGSYRRPSRKLALIVHSNKLALINASAFLCFSSDESLSNLEQISQLEQARDRGEWNALTVTERQQQQSNLQHLGMLAHFDNILGRDTINTLKLLTSEVKSIFCHNTMVDRVAAMLNYFLLNLVGPRKDRFKVKIKNEVEFDPSQTVKEICRIYINLGDHDKFCLAISQDGRSYSHELFTYADSVLVRIGGGVLIGEMGNLATKIKQLEAKYKEEQEFIADAPEEFLDPIMSTIMTDPVILPSSKVTVDRSTIARHLLSDQTDPFNRAPLTMDKIESDSTLKAKIEAWIAERRTSAKS